MQIQQLKDIFWEDTNSTSWLIWRLSCRKDKLQYSNLQQRVCFWTAAIQITCQKDGVFWVLVFPPEAGIGTKIKNYHCVWYVSKIESTETGFFSAFRDQWIWTAFLDGVTTSIVWAGHNLKVSFGKNKISISCPCSPELKQVPLPYHTSMRNNMQVCTTITSPWENEIEAQQPELKALVCYGQVSDVVIRRPRLQCLLQSPLACIQICPSSQQQWSQIFQTFRLLVLKVSVC